MIVLAVSALSILGVVAFRLADHRAPIEGKLIKQLSSPQVKVSNSKASELNTKTLTADSPPTGSVSLQSTTNPNSDSAPTSTTSSSELTSPIQSTVNLNSSTAQANPLVQSLITSLP